MLMYSYLELKLNNLEMGNSSFKTNIINYKRSKHCIFNHCLVSTFVCHNLTTFPFCLYNYRHFTAKQPLSLGLFMQRWPLRKYFIYCNKTNAIHRPKETESLLAFKCGCDTHTYLYSHITLYNFTLWLCIPKRAPNNYYTISKEKQRNSRAPN